MRELAAGIVIGLLAAGAAAWVALSFGLLNEREDWRTAVVEYMELYTNETFASLHPDAALQAMELSALGAKVGADLTPEKIALPGLRFTVGVHALLRRLAAWARSPMSTPSAPRSCFCVIANRAADAPASLGKAPGRSVARLVVARADAAIW